MKIQHRGHEPKVESSAYIAPTAVLVGNVEVGAHSRVMYGAVLDSEATTVSIGASSIICENVVIRATGEGDIARPVVIGNHVFIGPHATLLGCALDRYVYVATGATVLQGAKIGAGAVIAVGALIHANAVVPEGTFIPPHNIAIGEPVQVYPPSDKDLVTKIRAVGFPTAAFGIRPDPTDRFSVCRWATEVRSKEFAAHLSDVMIE